MRLSGTPVARAASSLVAGTLLALALLPFATRLPNFVVPDDGYFYARIAYNLARGLGSTFDGGHTTSGYHLPWALALAAVSKVIGLFTSNVRVHLAGHLVLACTIAIATVRRFFHGTAFRICALVLFVAMFGLTEMSLAIPILLGLLDSLLERNGRTALWLAIALPLVRIDLSCITVTIACVLLLRSRDRRRALGLIGATVVGMALQLAIMKMSFGHFVSVAAFLKLSVRSSILENIHDNASNGPFQLFMYAGQLAIAARALSLQNNRRTWAATLGCLSFLVLHTCFSIVRPWYWAPSWLGLLFILEHASSSSRARAVRMTTLGVALAFVVHAIRSEYVYAADQRHAATFLSELRSKVPEHARLFTYDNPGFLGYFSGFDVVDGDGLVNDYAYARRYLGGGLAGYLEEENLCYLVVNDVDAEPVLEIADLVVRRDEVEPLFAIHRNRPNQADFALYRLRASRCALAR